MHPRNIIVTGAGIIGVCCALYLQRAGHHVTLIEREAPGEGCSKGNSGLFESNAVVPLASPGILKQIPGLLADPKGPLAIRWAHLPRLMPWLWRFVLQAQPHRAHANALALAPLVKGAMAAYRPLLDMSQTTGMVRDTGWIWVFEHESARRAMQWEFDYLDELEIDYRELRNDALFDNAPALSRDISLGVFFPTTRACTNPFRFVQALAETFTKQGGEIERAEVKLIEPRSTDIRIYTGNGTLNCQTVVVAAGAWSGRLARQLGEPVPLGTERGYHAMLPDASVDLPIPVMFAEHKFVAHRMEHGLRLAGTAELGGLDRPPDWRRADHLLHHAKRLLPGLQPGEVRRWMGFRPTLPDSLPVIGASHRHKNVYYAFGHQHLGLTLGGITGRMIAALIDGDQAVVDPYPYRVDRFRH